MLGFPSAEWKFPTRCKAKQVLKDPVYAVSSSRCMMPFDTLQQGVILIHIPSRKIELVNVIHVYVIYFDVSGIPLVIVGISMGVTQLDGYGNERL